MKKVLVVEDDGSLRDIYKLILENAKFTVDLAADGTSAIKKVRSNKYDLVMLDLMMPEVDGIDVLKEMRANDWGQQVKVVVMTNMGIDKGQFDLEKYDVKEIVLKVDMLPDDLLELVQKHI